jgi:BASS family bile acid:Na+ symporter
MTSQIDSLFKIYGKVFALLATMVLGASFPQAHGFSFLIQYLLMVMLFLAFLDIRFRLQTFQISILWVLLANLAVGFLSYAALISFDSTYALTAFMTAIAPTAIAAPVIMTFIKGQIDYVVAAVLVTNVSSAVIIPVTLPFLIESQVRISVWEVLEPVLIVMFLPLLVAQLVSRLPSGTQMLLHKGKRCRLRFGCATFFLSAPTPRIFCAMRMPIPSPHYW